MHNLLFIFFKNIKIFILLCKKKDNNHLPTQPKFNYCYWMKLLLLFTPSVATFNVNQWVQNVAFPQDPLEMNFLTKQFPINVYVKKLDFKPKLNTCTVWCWKPFFMFVAFFCIKSYLTLGRGWTFFNSLPLEMSSATPKYFTPLTYGNSFTQSADSDAKKSYFSYQLWTNNILAEFFSAAKAADQ